MEYLKNNSGHYLKSGGGFYLSSKPHTLNLYAFNDIADVYAALRPNDKVSFLLRHGERPEDDWSQTAPLTPTGIEQANLVGAKLRGGLAFINQISCHSTDTVRTRQTAFLITQNRFDAKYQTVDDIPLTGAIDGSAYLTGEGQTYELISKYAYGETLQPDEAAHFKDIDEVSNQITQIILENSTEELNIFTSHDSVIVPYLVYMTERRLPDLKFWEDKYWLNFIAGIALLQRENGDIEIYPVRGLDTGTFKPSWA